MNQSAADIVKGFYETVFQTGDVQATEHFMAEDFMDHAPWPGQPATREGFRAGTEEMRKAFPDLAIKPSKLFEEDGKVAAVVRVSGTHHGEFMGEKPTGRSFEVDGVDILRVEDGKLREHWGVIDSDQIMAQLRLSLTA